MGIGARELRAAILRTTFAASDLVARDRQIAMAGLPVPLLLSLLPPGLGAQLWDFNRKIFSSRRLSPARVLVSLASLLALR